MRSSANRALLYVLPVLALAGAFWFLLLAPKREEASELEMQATDLQAQVTEQEQLAAAAEEARQDFPRAYRRVVVLGKAAPEDDDTSSLLVQLDGIASDADVKFISLEAQGGEGGAAPAPAPTPATPAQTAESSEQNVENAESGAAATPGPAPATPTAPTEASAALLPIGAAIGPAGLPVIKYSLAFEGDFFHLADFLQGLDELVKTRDDGTVGVRGRLITVDSFELTPVGDPGPNPDLSASFTITTFLTPADEGVTAGASPTGPAPPMGPVPASTDASQPGSTTASAETP